MSLIGSRIGNIVIHFLPGHVDRIDIDRPTLLYKAFLHRLLSSLALA